MNSHPISAAFTAAQITTFARIVGMLGSSYDGERANAARIATRMLSERGITWGELISAAMSWSGASRSAGRAAPQPRPSPWQAGLPSIDSHWREYADFCVAKAAKLLVWEREFLLNLLRRRRALSPVELTMLGEICQKITPRSWNTFWNARHGGP